MTIVTGNWRWIGKRPETWYPVTRGVSDIRSTPDVGTKHQTLSTGVSGRMTVLTRWRQLTTGWGWHLCTDTISTEHLLVSVCCRYRSDDGVTTTRDWGRHNDRGYVSRRLDTIQKGGSSVPDSGNREHRGWTHSMKRRCVVLRRGRCVSPNRSCTGPCRCRKIDWRWTNTVGTSWGSRYRTSGLSRPYPGRPKTSPRDESVFQKLGWDFGNRRNGESGAPWPPRVVLSCVFEYELPWAWSYSSLSFQSTTF